MWSAQCWVFAPSLRAALQIRERYQQKPNQLEIWKKRKTCWKKNERKSKPQKDMVQRGSNFFPVGRFNTFPWVHNIKSVSDCVSDRLQKGTWLVLLLLFSYKKIRHQGHHINPCKYYMALIIQTKRIYICSDFCGQDMFLFDASQKWANFRS